MPSSWTALFQNRIISLQEERAALEAFPLEEVTEIIREVGFTCDLCGQCCTRRFNGHFFLFPDEAEKIRAIDPDSLDVAQSAWDSPVDANPAPTLHRLVLAQNTPNPFNPTTTIAFELPEAASIDLEIFATNGRRVRSLLQGKRPAGTHHLVWDGRDTLGRRVPSGTYFYRLTVDGQHITRKMQLLK